MKVAMLQLNFTIGDIEGNAQKILRGYKDACEQCADIVVSTELGLFGYPPRDLLLYDDYLDLQDEHLQHLMKHVGETLLIVGIAEKHKLINGSLPLFNSAVVIYKGQIIHTQRKSLLPNYDVFDEKRYFEPFRNNFEFIPYPDKNIVLLICEDIWGGQEIINGRKLYDHDPLEELESCDVETLIVINASPYYWGKGSLRFDLVAGIATSLNCDIIYANQVGANDELIFDGRSFAVNPLGNCIAAAKVFEEDLVIVDTDDKDASAEYLYDAGSQADLHDGLVLGIKDYLRKIGNKDGVVIGLSGGIDSAITAALAVEALGPDKVVGIAMPSKYSSQGSVIDAQALADNLEIPLKKIPILQVFSAFAGAVARVIGWATDVFKKGDVTEENVQARIRGMILMAFSNRTGKILLTTGNKSELAVGYCTLYGDMAGGLAAISDLPKTLVYQLAEYINRNGEVIPRNTIDKPPSAELSPDQKDSDTLPPYDVLDPILETYIENQMSLYQVIQLWPNEEETIRKVVRMVNNNEFKRRQMPPGLRMTAKAFGSGRRMPIAAKFIS